MTDDQVYYYASANIPQHPPTRVVSTVPSMTETLFELGFGGRVVGISADCLLPEGKLDSIYRVGPVDALNVADIISLQPDVVIVNREDNTASDIDALDTSGLHIWKTFPRTVQDAMNLIWETVHLFMVDDRMIYERVNLINRTIDWVGGASEAKEHLTCKVFVPLLRSPLTTFKQGTYPHDLLRVAGGANIFADLPTQPTNPDPAEDTSRYPVVSIEQVQAAQPDVILLPSYPLSFTEDDIEWVMNVLDVPATRNGQVYLIDGTLIIYHGVRLARALNEISAVMCEGEGEP